MAFENSRRRLRAARVLVVLAFAGLTRTTAWSADPFLLYRAPDGEVIGSNHAVGGDLLYFTSLPSGLWRTDGTKAGTFAVADGLAALFSGELATVGDTAFFVSRAFGADTEVWRSDGSVEGTAPLQPRIIRPTGLASVGTRLFVFNETLPGATELRTIQRNDDGTLQPPVLVGTAGVFVEQPAVGTSRQLFFFARDRSMTSNVNLWVSDGATFGTTVQSVPSTIIRPFAFGERLGFLADGGIGVQLWSTDGTPGGGIVLEDAPLGQHGVIFSTIQTIGATADRIYFSRRATDGSTTQLWATDGTPNASVPLRDPLPTGGNPFLDDPTEVVDVYGTAFFIATGSPRRHDFMLFRTDGTAAGTVAVARIGAVAGNRRPRILGVLHGNLVVSYAATDGYPAELRGISLDWPSLRSLRTTLERIESACSGVADSADALANVRILLRDAHATPATARRALSAVEQRLQDAADDVPVADRPHRVCRAFLERATRRAARAVGRVS